MSHADNGYGTQLGGSLSFSLSTICFLSSSSSRPTSPAWAVIALSSLVNLTHDASNCSMMMKKKKMKKMKLKSLSLPSKIPILHQHEFDESRELNNGKQCFQLTFDFVLERVWRKVAVADSSKIKMSTVKELPAFQEAQANHYYNKN